MGEHGEITGKNLRVLTALIECSASLLLVLPERSVTDPDLDSLEFLFRRLPNGPVLCFTRGVDGGANSQIDVPAVGGTWVTGF